MQFAAATVIIALLGLFVMRINFFNGIAVSAALTVFMVMIGALLLLPAVLSILGTWAFSGRMAWVSDGEAVARQRLTGVPHAVGRILRYVGWVLYLPVTLVGLAYRRIVRRGKAPEPHHPSAFARYGNWLQHRPWLLGSIALVVMLVIALPDAVPAPRLLRRLGDRTRLPGPESPTTSPRRGLVPASTVPSTSPSSCPKPGTSRLWTS